MNKTRFSFLIAVAALLVAAGDLRAQISIQRITLSLLAEYQTNTFNTTTAGLTNEVSKTHDILIATGNVTRAIAIDLEGTNWTIWEGAELAREVNLTNGNEGIFLRRGTNNLNVSSFFGGSFSNNFTGELTSAFSGSTSNIFGLTNEINGIPSNAAPSFQLVHGVVRMTGPTNFVTNDISTAGLHFISLNTTNIKFNVVGVGDGAITTVAGSLDGTVYRMPINSEILGTAGSIYINGTTNTFDTGTTPPTFFTGPIRGSFVVGAPNFSEITGP